jgi:phosphatidylserine/phosphatidylglycerophosphate/cardiolipin synthase-like enzyme
LVDNQQAASEYSKTKNLKFAGIETKVDTRSAYMHHKFCVIDDVIVTTGSFNFSLNADTNNNENLLIIYDVSLAGEYSDEFGELWGMGELV